MNNDYRYQLEKRKLTRKAVQKTACPSCGRKITTTIRSRRRSGQGLVDVLL